MKHRYIFFAIAALIFLGLVLNRWQIFNVTKAPKAPSNILHVGTNATFPPFTFIDKDGTVAGFDIDLINEIARQLGKQVEIHDLSFNSLIPELQAGSLHVLAAGISPTPQRARRVLFSTVYLKQDPLVIITKQDAPTYKSLQDLIGKKVVVNMGYTADTVVSDIAGIDVVRLDTTTEGFVAVKSGQADAFVTSKQASRPFFEQNKQTTLRVTELPDTQETYALAISPKYPGLKEDIDRIINEMKHNGHFEQLGTKWHIS